MGNQITKMASLKDATAQLGHSDEATTKRHYVERVHVAPDVRVVIDQLVTQVAENLLAEGLTEGKEQ